MSWREGPVLGLDLETTGTDPMTALPIAFALVWFGGGEVLKRRYGLIDPGVEIPAEATAVHGISTAECRERGGALGPSLIGLREQLCEASHDLVPIVACNAAYDLTVLNQNLWRVHGFDLFWDGWEGPVIDPLVLDRHCDTYRKGSRKLSDLCKHYGVDPGKAHHAGSDAEAATRVAFAIAEKFPEVGDADLDLLHVLQQGWHREFITHLSDYYVSQKREPLAAEEGDWPVRGLRGVSL